MRCRFSTGSGQLEISGKPSTSELIDWVNALSLSGIDTEHMRKELFIGVVLKKDEDVETIRHSLD